MMPVFHGVRFASKTSLAIPSADTIAELVDESFVVILAQSALVRSG